VKTLVNWSEYEPCAERSRTPMPSKSNRSSTTEPTHGEASDRHRPDRAGFLDVSVIRAPLPWRAAVGGLAGRAEAFDEQVSRLSHARRRNVTLQGAGSSLPLPGRFRYVSPRFSPDLAAVLDANRRRKKAPGFPRACVAGVTPPPPSRRSGRTSGESLDCTASLEGGHEHQTRFASTEKPLQVHATLPVNIPSAHYRFDQEQPVALRVLDYPVRHLGRRLDG